MAWDEGKAPGTGERGGSGSFFVWDEVNMRGVFDL